jgi:hypothetical protein
MDSGSGRPTGTGGEDGNRWAGWWGVVMGGEVVPVRSTTAGGAVDALNISSAALNIGSDLNDPAMSPRWSLMMGSASQPGVCWGGRGVGNTISETSLSLTSSGVESVVHAGVRYPTMNPSTVDPGLYEEAGLSSRPGEALAARARKVREGVQSTKSASCRTCRAFVGSNVVHSGFRGKVGIVNGAVRLLPSGRMADFFFRCLASAVTCSNAEETGVEDSPGNKRPVPSAGRLGGVIGSSGSRAASMTREGDRFRWGVAGGDDNGEEEHEWYLGVELGGFWRFLGAILRYPEALWPWGAVRP